MHLFFRTELVAREGSGPVFEVVVTLTRKQNFADLVEMGGVWVEDSASCVLSHRFSIDRSDDHVASCPFVAGKGEALYGRKFDSGN